MLKKEEACEWRKTHRQWQRQRQESNWGLGAISTRERSRSMAEGKESFSRVSEASLKQYRRAPRHREQSFST